MFFFFLQLHFYQLLICFFFFTQAILNGFLTEFPNAVKQTAASIVGAAVEIYRRMSIDLLPTPAKSHYVFNLRDLSKCVQGKVLQTNNHAAHSDIFKKQFCNRFYVLPLNDQLKQACMFSR